MTERIIVIESDEYRQEVAALVNDQIIRDMAEQLPPGLDEAELDSYPFMKAASYEYGAARGGKLARTIGGPARAVKQIYRQLHPDGFTR